MKRLKIQVLWSGCPTCKVLYLKVLEIAKKIDEGLEVEYITDVTKIVELWLMSSPVFIVDDQVISAWKLPTEAEIETAILEKCNS